MENVINVYFRKIGCEYFAWISLSHLLCQNYNCITSDFRKKNPVVSYTISLIVTLDIFVLITLLLL
jgi:hypothetical protein